jgi:putative copper resistance protein D
VFLSPWDAAAVALKTVTYAATFGAAGAVFFLRYNAAFIADAPRLTVRRMVRSLAVLAVAAGAAHIMVTAASMSGGAAGMRDSSLIRMVLQAGAGRANAIRAIGILLAAIGVRPQRPASWALLGAAMAATSFAWTGHAHSLDPNVYPVLLLGLHLLAAAFWLGALAPLGLVARDGDLAKIGAAAARFGAAAVFVVIGMIAAGATLLWLLLGGFADLPGSTYGRFAALKLVLVAGLLGLAAFNKLRLTPRLLDGDAGAVRSLRTSIRCELLFGALILTVTAALTTLAGPPALE